MNSTTTKVKEPKKAKAIGDHTMMEIGDVIRDRITGRQGTFRERHTHLNGCVYAIMELDGKPDDIDYSSVERFELMKIRPEFHPTITSFADSHVKLGDEVKDILTGFSGHAVLWSVPMYGVHRIAIEPGMLKDGKLGDMTWFDECRIEVIKAKKPPVAAKMKPARNTEGSALTTTFKRDTFSR